jgi:hypothetical protein
MVINWEALGAIANLLAAIGVIATLIYLAIQIRQNNNQLQGSATIAVYDYQRSLTGTLTQDQELYKIALRGNEDLNLLDSWERQRFTIWCIQETGMWEARGAGRGYLSREGKVLARASQLAWSTRVVESPQDYAKRTILPGGVQAVGINCRAKATGIESNIRLQRAHKSRGQGQGLTRRCSQPLVGVLPRLTLQKHVHCKLRALSPAVADLGFVRPNASCVPALHRRFIAVSRFMRVRQDR